MDDKELNIGATACVAWIGWTIAGGAVLFAWVFDLNHLGQCGIVFGAIAATLHVRSFLCRQTAAMRNAYEIGRDYGALTRMPTRRLPQQERPGAGMDRSF